MSTKAAILNYLMHNHIGSENAIRAKKLCKYMGLTNKLLRKALNELRAEGQPICSDSNGYFYAANVDEIDHTISHLDDRAKEMDIARKGLEKSKASFAPLDVSGGDPNT